MSRHALRGGPKPNNPQFCGCCTAYSRDHRLDAVNCPVCSGDTRVLRTDDTDRKRQCVRCGHPFTTQERLKDELERQDKAVKTVLEAAERIKATA